MMRLRCSPCYLLNYESWRIRRRKKILEQTRKIKERNSCVSLSKCNISHENFRESMFQRRNAILFVVVKMYNEKRYIWETLFLCACEVLWLPLPTLFSSSCLLSVSKVFCWKYYLSIVLWHKWCPVLDWKYMSDCCCCSWIICEWYSFRVLVIQMILQLFLLLILQHNSAVIILSGVSYLL